MMFLTLFQLGIIIISLLIIYYTIKKKYPIFYNSSYLNHGLNDVIIIIFTVFVAFNLYVLIIILTE